MNQLRIFSSRVLIIAAIALSGWGCSNSRPSDRPNVLVILLDDAGYGDLGCHGNPDVQTPTIDRLWTESTRLTRFYSQPVCTPTRACLMTGRDHYRTKASDTLNVRSMMDPDEITMAEVFRAAGYRTGLFGKWHLGDNYPMRSIDQGFEESVQHRGGGMAHWFDRPGSSYFDPVLDHNGKSRKYRGYCNDIWFEEAGRFIKSHRNEPFLCYIATNLPHDPLMTPNGLWLPFHERGINEENAIIYGMMKNVDDNLRRLLKQLDDDGLAKNTIIILSSDNGPAMQLSEHQLRYNANLRGQKKQVYEGGIRVPMLVRWPGRIPAGRDVDRIGSMIDVLPTLTEACGISGPADVKLDGKSLWPLLSGVVSAEQWPDRTLFFQHTLGLEKPERGRNVAVRSQRWKLVMNPFRLKGEGAVNVKELYDEEADPGETRDVAADNSQVLDELQKRYESWFEDVCSSRGFDVPRIQLGTEHENPTVINRRHWRVDRGSGKDQMGHWEVQVVREVNCRITVQLKDTQRAPADVHVQLGNVHLSRHLDRDALRVVFDPVTLPAGPANLEAWYSGPDRQPAAVVQVEFEQK
jgi:arylsulfatase A